MADALNSNKDRIFHIEGTPCELYSWWQQCAEDVNVSEGDQLLCLRMLLLQCVLGIWLRPWDNHSTGSFSYGSARSKYIDINEGAYHTVSQTVIGHKFSSFLVTVSKIATPSQPIQYYLYVIYNIFCLVTFENYLLFIFYFIFVFSLTKMQA